MEGKKNFHIASGKNECDLLLPDDFNSEGDGCLIHLELAESQWWLVGPECGEPGGRVLVESGDRLTIHYGSSDTEVLFAYCPVSPDQHRPRG